MASRLLNQDVGSGLLFAAFGVAGLWFGQRYNLGTAWRMGPGYFPTALSLLLIAFGLGIGAKGLLKGGAEIERFHLRPTVFITVAIVIFSLTIERFGLVPASLAVVLVGALGGREFRLGEVSILALVLTAAAAIGFVYLLGLPWAYFSLPD